MFLDNLVNGVCTYVCEWISLIKNFHCGNKKCLLLPIFCFNFIAYAEWIINFHFFCFILFYRKQPKTFAFDHCFYSTDINANNFATQENVFDTIGRDILDNAFQGYNACIFAYGQTGENLINLPVCISYQFTITTFNIYFSNNIHPILDFETKLLPYVTGVNKARLPTIWHILLRPISVVLHLCRSHFLINCFTKL